MERNITLAIAVSALVTALMRTIPILLLSRFRLAPVAQQWLGFIPAAIIAAITVAELIGKPALTSNGISVSFLAAAMAAAAGILTRGLFTTVITGMTAYMGLRYLFGMP